MDDQRGSGGTELLPAVQRAMSMPRQTGHLAQHCCWLPTAIVSGEEGVFDYIRENLGQSNVFAFGIGESVNRYLIEGMAKAGMGEPFIVGKESDAEAMSDQVS